MQARLNPYKTIPATMKALGALESAVLASGIEDSLIHLVRTRASQINGCAFCIHMHTSDARGHGESEERLYLLDAWRDSPLFTPRERAALAWVEAVTLVSETHVPDLLYEDVRKVLSEADIASLTLLAATTNVWNRITVSFRSPHPVQGTAVAA